MRWSFSACKVAQRDTSRPLKASIQLQTHCDCWEDLARAEMTVDKNTFRLTLSHAYMFVRCTTHMDMHEMHGTAHPARYHYSRALRLARLLRFIGRIVIGFLSLVSHPYMTVDRCSAVPRTDSSHMRHATQIEIRMAHDGTRTRSMREPRVLLYTPRPAASESRTTGPCSSICLLRAKVHA